MRREIVLDTETTGLDPAAGHRIVEIGCVELGNHVPTGRVFHAYLNPERDMPDEALRVHGLSGAFLADKPVFAEIAAELLAFLECAADGTPDPARLVAHNGVFDLAFLDAEFARSGRPALGVERLLDTLALARARHPGAPASLDALCRRFDVDASARTQHGALFDAQLLAEVYLALLGGRQPGLALAPAGPTGGTVSAPTERPIRAPRPHAPSGAELAAWSAFIDSLPNPLWRPAQAAAA
jgi:DNA polymerase-3 subunit epsilon